MNNGYVKCIPVLILLLPPTENSLHSLPPPFDNCQTQLRLSRIHPIWHFSVNLQTAQSVVEYKVGQLVLSFLVCSYFRTKWEVKEGCEL